MSELDDFFAKKDRKKTKAKKITTDELARKMDDLKKPEKPQMLKDKVGIFMGNIGTDLDDGKLTKNSEEDEEWKNFEEEKKDYSGLKILNLSIQDSDDHDKNDCDKNDLKKESNSIDPNNDKRSPWKFVESSPKSVEKKGAYVPPVLRNQSHKSEPPDITNQKFFPTLSAAVTTEPWSKKKQESGFEEVRNSRSHSSRNDPTKTSQPLRIGNKFGALETENS